MSVTVRPATAADEPEIRRVVSEAFGRPAEAVLVDELRGAGHARVELVSEGDGWLTGHVLFSALPLAGADRPVLALAPLAVLPACHRRGIGTALVEAGLAAARDGGWPAVVLLGDPAYYGRFGFRPAVEMGITGPYGAGPAFQALALPAYGGEAGEARFPEPFAGV